MRRMRIQEKALLQGARRFDREALTSIYDLYSPEIYRYGFRLLGDEHLAEDCLSETFTRFLKVTSSGNGPREHLRAYLYRIAHNWITDHYRRLPPPELEMKDDTCASDHEHLEQSVDVNMLRAKVRSALRLLTPEQRQVVILRFLQGFEHEEIAAALQKEVSAVKALQHRAIEALKRILLTEENSS
jgi:RNA polymerase sigma-70 factor (ECF subfamily)